MASGTLSGNSGTLTFDNLNDNITLGTINKFVDSDISLDIKVTKAVLNSTTSRNTFDVQIPNGSSTPVTFHFSVDANGNTVVT